MHFLKQPGKQAEIPIFYNIYVTNLTSRPQNLEYLLNRRSKTFSCKEDQYFTHKQERLMTIKNQVNGYMKKLNYCSNNYFKDYVFSGFEISKSIFTKFNT